MSGWLQFSALWMITGNPLAAGAILLIGYAVVDSYTFGFLRGYALRLRNWQRGRRLEHELLLNPHNRKARADLGEILLEQRRWQRAIEVVKPLADQNHSDLNALWILGLACLASGRVEQGELFLSEVRAGDPQFRRGKASLELGRFRLQRNDAKGALEPLRAYLSEYNSSVEGHYLLSLALLKSGDASGARAEREAAWTEYVTSLPYQRRSERKWAWRARPSRPALYAAMLCAVLLLVGTAARNASLAHQPHLEADVRNGR